MTARRPHSQVPAGPVPPHRAGGQYMSDLCRGGEHGRCRHPANALRADGCECSCHERAAA